jgi:hypothetical protein
VIFGGDECDGTRVAILSRRLDDVNTDRASSDNDQTALLAFLDRARARDWLARLSLELLLFCRDVHVAIGVYLYWEGEERVEGRRIFDVSVLGIEAGSVPGADEVTFLCEDTLSGGKIISEGRGQSARGALKHDRRFCGATG